MKATADEPRFAIYCRISRDRVGAGLGIERQLSDCQALATQLGGTVVATFADNDISAYSGKRRPGYEALLAAMRDGTVTTVLAWHADRIHRSMVELEDYVAASDLHGIATQTVRAGLIDLSTPSGRLVARQLGAVARYEVEHSIERQRAAKLQAARAGLPSGGNRPYGYEQNGMDVRQSEAVIVVEAAERFVSGDSYRSIAADLNARGIPTAKGHRWAGVNIRNVILRKRNIAVRVHNSDEYPAQWSPLFTDELWNELQLAIARGKSLYGDHSYSRLHLLKGFVFCGICSNRMNIVSAQGRHGSYVALQN
ncbi:recombinase family protein [Arthrobacter sp. H14-L1]|uniref:recombinase family protein n=1 Tax=Arthrobacter sp. H14-L1 TaxID=2996697 RepID=UPI0022714F62|nr:recombinase family protein [Arthrobacter sp. H14-L1]MCY0906318.1 recombinase family protein [Arthrobacter sp. H14-L1]